jgi:hypothetical protein
MARRGRKGGLAAAAARRRRMRRDWTDELVEQLARDPAPVVKRLLASNNGLAISSALALAKRIQSGRMREWRDELNERERMLDRAEARSEELVDFENDLKQSIEALQAQYDELRQRTETGQGLAELLREAHTRGLLEPALIALDLFEVVDDEPVSTQA